MSRDDQRLLQETDAAVQTEREATVRVLRISLRLIGVAFFRRSENFISRVRMERYRFSEDEARRRIDAMKLLKEVPAAEEKWSRGP